jgi:hypothetical protein
MYVIQHKGMSITDTASASEAGSWNLLFKMYPTLAKKSRRDLETLEYKAKKTIPHSKQKKRIQEND